MSVNITWQMYDCNIMIRNGSFAVENSKYDMKGFLAFTDPWSNTKEIKNSKCFKSKLFSSKKIEDQTRVEKLFSNALLHNSMNSITCHENWALAFVCFMSTKLQVRLSKCIDS